MIRYDHLEIHFLNVAADIDQHQFGVPTGFFVSWLIRRGWAAPHLMEDAPAIRAGTRTGCDTLWAVCDGQLRDSDLTDEGNAFASTYFEKHYFNDVIALFELSRTRPEALYEPEDTQANAAKVATMLDGRERATRVSAAFPSADDLLTRLIDSQKALLHSANFVPTVGSSTGIQHESFTAMASFLGGTHLLKLGAYVDRELGQHGFYVDIESQFERLQNALRAAWTEDERYGMSGASPLLNSVNLPMHAWMSPHPLLREVPLFRRYLWHGGRRALIVADTPAEIDRALQTLLEQVKHRLLPRLAELQTPAGLAAIKCRVPLTDSPVYFSPFDRSILVCAEMVSHPQLVALCDELLRLLDADQKTNPREVEQERKFVRDVRARATALGNHGWGRR